MNVRIMLNGAGLANVTRERWQKNARSCNRIHMPIDGKAIYHDIKKDCILRPDNAYLMVNSSTENLELLPDTQYYHMYIDFRTVPPLRNREALVVDLSADDFLMSLLKAVQALIRENQHTNRRLAIIEGRDEKLYEQVREILKVILAHLQRVWGLKAVENAKVESAMQYIHEHYTEQIRNNEIAQTLHINTRYLIRLFRRNVGMSPYQYLIQYRVERGAEALRSGKTVSETAYLCGYLSENAFRIAFKKIMGESPKTFVRQKEEKGT